MIVALLTILSNLAFIAEIVVLVMVVGLMADLLGFHIKSERRENAAEVREAIIEADREREMIRLEKEKAAEGGFFEEPFVRGFDTTGELKYRGMHRFPTPESEVYSKLMDGKVDDEIFTNTEGL